MSKHKLSEDSTIYHYTLLYRFTRKHPFYWCYSACLFLWALLDVAFWRLEGLVILACSFVALLLAHGGIAVLMRRLSYGTVPRIWGWGDAFPFYGYLPLGYVSASYWNRANRHRLLIGFALIALLYVWLPLHWLANAAVAHYLLLLPQLMYISKCLRKYPGGLIKAGKQDISYYKN